MSCLETLPPYVYSNIATHLLPRDLECLARVSKKCHEIFNSNLAWYPHIFGIDNPSNKKLIYEKVNGIWDPEFIQLFDNIERINRLPFIVMTFDQFIGKPNTDRFKEEYFSSPIVRVMLVSEDNYYMRMLLRIRNNATHQIYHAVLGFSNGFSPRSRFFDIHSVSKENCVIAKMADVTPKQLERVKRLINHQPTGLTRAHPNFGMEFEEPRKTADGKSVLELI